MDITLDSSFLNSNIFVTPEVLANELGLSYKQLSRLIYPNNDKSYRSFSVAKKSGGERIINAPKVKLKYIQRQLVEWFAKAYTPKSSCHGFLKDRSIVTNAEKHVGKNYVFNVDLKDFFGSIHFGRVKNLFMSSPFKYSHATATVLAQICCLNNSLPQGAPTSPIISNFICRKLDAQLQDVASKNNCDYTRYADDITFSFTCTKRKLPRSIVGFDEEGEAVPGNALTRIIKENGFEINIEKVRLKGKGARQEVTGLTVNKLVNVEREFIRQTSSMLHAWEKFGVVLAEKDYLEKYRTKPLLSRQERAKNREDGEFFIDVVKGRVNYIQMVRGKSDSVYRKLAYRLTRALGCENKKFLRSSEELITCSVFIVHNNLSEDQGSAFLLDDIGLVTNEHIVEDISQDNSELIEFFRENEIEIKRNAPFVYASKKNDLAVFDSSNGFSGVPSLRIGDDKNLRIGDTVTVVGYPDYSEGDSAYINRGKIIQIANRYGVDFMLLDIPILFGNSGGPVLNSKLEVIGVATRGSKKHDFGTKFNGFVPISYLIRMVQSPEYQQRDDDLGNK